MEHTSVKFLKLFIIINYNFLCLSSSSLMTFLFNYFKRRRFNFYDFYDVSYRTITLDRNNLNLRRSLFMSGKVSRIAS